MLGIDLNKVLGQFATQYGISANEIFEVYRRQTVVEGWAGLIGCIFAFVVVNIFLWKMYKAFRNDSQLDKGSALWWTILLV
jgi:protein-S-isoprenylcysteine O-methyltransferase Ste14